MSASRYTAIVLAGERGDSEPVAQATGAACKAMSPVAGVPMLWRVVAALRAVPAIDQIICVGPAPAMLAAQPGLAGELDAAGVTWMAPAASPSASAEAALTQLPADKPALITTADHALLLPEMVAALLADAPKCDLALGLVDYEPLRRAYPDARRTVWRFGRHDSYCGCNLFALPTANGRRLVSLWRDAEAQRKRPWRLIVALLGWPTVLRYLAGRLSLAHALARLSARTGTAIRPVLLATPEAAIDIDSVADLRLAESILAQRDGLAGRGS